MKTTASADLLECLYAAAIRLYPPGFRDRYSTQMRQTFRDAMRDNSLSRRSFLPLVIKDLIASLAKEYLAMLHETFTRPALLFNALVLTALSSGLALALYAIPQQVLRLGADDPQIAMADDLVAKLEQGIVPAEAVPAASVDMARSLSPFVIVYDDQGNPLASQAKLDGQTPVPPKGVFDYVRQHGEERLSWQPIRGRERGVRIATVMQRVNGAHPGFVLSGRNMREVETRIGQVQQMAGLTWIGMLGVILVGTALFGWHSRPKKA